MARIVFVCFGIAIVTLVTSFLGYMAYSDFLIKRDREFTYAVNAMRICNDPELVRDANMHEYCDNKEQFLLKSPRLLAARDVVCGIVPCSLFGKDRSESVIKALLENVSDTAFKSVLFCLFLYVVAVLFGFIRPGSREIPSIMLPIYTSRQDESDQKLMPYMPPSKRNSVSNVNFRQTSGNFKYE
jgi:hypothetical protein